MPDEPSIIIPNGFTSKCSGPACLPLAAVLEIFISFFFFLKQRYQNGPELKKIKTHFLLSFFSLINPGCLLAAKDHQP